MQLEDGDKLLKALILVGGFGTRLRPLSCTRPKALFPILNKPLLQWTFERLAKANIKDVILATSYQTEVLIKQHRIPRCGLSITFSRDPLKKPLGTAGPVKKAEKQIGHDSPFLVLNGDIFANVNYKEILDKHEKTDATATIALYRVDDPTRYGVAEITEQNCIKRFIEKPPRETAPSNLINAGVYALSQKIFKYILSGRKVSMEREVFPKLAEEGELYGYTFDGLWMDIGEPEDYLKINRTLLDTSIKPQKYNVEQEVKINMPVAFDKEVSIGNKSTIGPYAVLGRDVAVGSNVRIQNTTIFQKTVISDFASIDGAIVGDCVFVGKRVKIGRGCILGDYVRVKDNAVLGENVWVCPAREVSGKVSAQKRIV